MEYQDYYALLGVPKTATEKEIRSRYRKLARQFHPDVNPGNADAEAHFKQINEAYEVLSDPDKRRKYDEIGPRWKEYEQWQQAGGSAGGRQSAGGRESGSGRGPAGGRESAGGRASSFDWGPSGAGPDGARYQYRTVTEEDLRDLYGDEAPFSDFFETFFTTSDPGPARTGRARRAPRPRAGSDLEHPIDVTLADACRGTAVELQLQMPDGQSRRIEVKIPMGVRTGSRIRVAGQGGPGGAGGKAGDLYLVVNLLPDARYERRGDDLLTTATASLRTMVLGGETHVSTPDGRTLALSIPAGTQDGRVFRLRGQGMPHLGSAATRGDLKAEVHVRLPGRLSGRQRELFEEFVTADARETTEGASR